MYKRYVFTGNRIIIARNRDQARQYMKSRGFKGSYVGIDCADVDQDAYTIYIAR